MKRIITILLALVVAVGVYADNEKQYRKLIEQLDVADEAKAVEAWHPKEILDKLKEAVKKIKTNGGNNML